MQAQMIVLLLLATLGANASAQKDRMAPGEATPPVSYTKSSTSRQAWQVCLQEICGAELNGFYRGMEQYAKDNEKRHLRLYKPLQLAAINSGREELREEEYDWENLLRAVREDREISSPRALQLHDIFSSIGHIGKATYNDDGTLDLDATRAALADLPKEAQALSLKGLAASAEVGRKYPAVVLESLSVLRQRMTAQEIHKQIKETVALTEKGESDLAKHFGIPRERLFSGVSQWEGVKQRLNSGQFDAYDVEQLTSRYHPATLLKTLVEVFPQSSSRKPVKLRSLLTPERLKEIEERLRNIKAYFANPAKEGAARAALTDAADWCFYRALTVEKYLPTENDIENFKPIEKAWRNEFLNKLEGHLSGETMGYVRPFFDGLKIDPPLTPKSWMKGILRDLENIKISSRNRLSQQSDEARQLDHVSSLDGKRTDGELDKMASGTKKLCVEKGKPISDEADMSSDRVRIGPVTMKSPKEGRGVAFHEYAHTLSGFLRRGKISEHSKKIFDGWRDCLLKTKYGGDRFLEEDFGDLLSFNLGRQPINPICQFMNDQDADKFTLIQTDPKDKHATNLRRLLHGASIYGKIPTMCTSALEAKGEKFDMPNCMSP